MSAWVCLRETLAAATKVNHAPTAAQIVKTADQNVVEVRMSGRCFISLLSPLKPFRTGCLRCHGYTRSYFISYSLSEIGSE